MSEIREQIVYLIIFLLTMTSAYAASYILSHPGVTTSNLEPGQADNYWSAAVNATKQANTNFHQQPTRISPEARQVVRAHAGRLISVNTSPRPHNRSADIVVIGDSFTYGLGVDDAHTYPARLAAFRSAQLQENITVVNMGMPGTGARDYLRIYQHATDRYQPQTVIVSFHPKEDVMTYRIRYFIKQHAAAITGKNGTSLTDQRRRLLTTFLARHSNNTIVDWYLTPIAAAADRRCQHLIIYTYAPVSDHDAQYWSSWAARHDAAFYSAPEKLFEPRFAQSATDPHYTAAGNRVLARHLATKMGPPPRAGTAPCVGTD